MGFHVSLGECKRPGSWVMRYDFAEVAVIDHCEVKTVYKGYRDYRVYIGVILE